MSEPESTIIAHLDKDINMIPGWHYNWELRRLGKVIREATTYFVTPEEAEYNFYYQLIVGDTTDNIKGVMGLGPKKAEKFLNSTPRERWLEEITEMFSCPEELEMNAKCLWIWRKENDIWQWPIKIQETQSETLEGNK